MNLWKSAFFLPLALTASPLGELAEQRVVRDAGPGRVGLAEVFRQTYAHDRAGRERQASAAS